jgi:hypothetical protein
MCGPGLLETIALDRASMRAEQDDLSELTALSQSVWQALLPSSSLDELVSDTG